MKFIASSKFIAVVAAVFLLNAASYTQSFDGRSPLSTSVLVARALRNGTLHFAKNAMLQPAGVLGNVQASEGGSPVNEDPIVANPINPRQLLTGGNDYNCGSIQGFHTTGDGGKTWTHTCLGALAGHSGVGDPGVGYDLNGTAFITGIDEGSNNVIAFEKSTNNGQSWSSPAIAVSATFSGGLPDKDWLQVDTNPSSPFKNSLYISVTQFDAPETHSQISVTRSNDGGSTWNTVLVDSVQAAPIYDQFSDLAIGKDGAVYVTWIRCNASAGDCGGSPTSMMFSKSTDGGNTWSSPVTMATVMLAPDQCGCAFYGNLPNTFERVSNIPAVDIDNSNGSHSGTLYATFYNWTGTFMQVGVVHSTTGGSSWSSFVPVAPASDIHDQFFPWLTVNASGIVGVTWLDRRNDPSNLSYETFATGSTNGGTSFVTNKQIASVSSNPNNDGFGGAAL